jgi:hypothetical protein
VTGWPELHAALDAVAERGEAIRFWWRDDDAGREHPALARLLELAEQRGLPIALAVVPAWLHPAAQAWIAACSRATVLQHGYAHANHAGNGEKPVELGGRADATIAAELERGRAALIDAFGAAWQAVLVPPWNRIERSVVAHLTDHGFVGLSAFGRARDAQPVEGLSQVNTHVDPIDWRGSRNFVGEERALEQLLAALDPDEPVGILSHHLALDEPGWRFLDQLLGLTAAHPAARWCSARDLFEAAP